MKVFYETDKTYVIAQNHQELMDYLLRVDCNSESPIRYTARLQKSISNNDILIVSINKYNTQVTFPLFLADGIKTDCLTRQYDNLEIFRNELKNFFNYLDDIDTKCEKEKEYNSILKKLTPKEPKPKKSKPKKEEDNKNISIINGKKVVWYD